MRCWCHNEVTSVKVAFVCFLTLKGKALGELVYKNAQSYNLI